MVLDNLQKPVSLVHNDKAFSFINGFVPPVYLVEEELRMLQNRMEQIIARTVPRLSMERRRMQNMEKIDEARLYHKLSILASGLESDFITKVDGIQWDDFADNSIKITFHNRKDLILNIYVNEEEDEDSIEEAFLSFNDGKVDRIEYNTLPLMVRFLKEFL